MAEPVTRRGFLFGVAALAVLPVHHRPTHKNGPKPSPSPTPTSEPSAGLYEVTYSDTY